MQRGARSAPRTPRRHVRPDPAHLTVGPALQDHLPARGRGRLGGRSVGEDPFLGRGRAEADPDPVHRRDPLQPRHHYRRSFRDGARRRQNSRDGMEALSLAGPVRGLTRAVGLKRRQPADHRGHRQQQG